MSGSADAATYYVSTTGSDSNDGQSVETPFLKLSKACSLVVPGDTIYMWGNHGMKGSFGCKSGTSWDAPVTIRVLPGEKLTFSRAIPTEGAYFNTGKLGNARYISIEGEYDPITDTRSLVFDFVGVGGNGEYMRFLNTEHKNCKCTSAINGGNHWILDNVDVHHNGSGGLSHGMYTHMSYSLIRRSKFHHNSGYGLHMYNVKAGSGACIHGQPESAETPTGCGLIDNVIEDTISYANGDGGMVLSPGDGNIVRNSIFARNGTIGIKANSANALLVNNTFYDDPLWVAGGCDRCAVHNNLVWTPDGSMPIRIDAGALDTVISANFTSKEPVPAVPIVVDAEAGDFRLAPGSPAIDAGIALAEVEDDHVGTPRPQGLGTDIGAYEYLPPELKLAPVILDDSGNLSATHPTSHLFDGCTADIATCKTGNQGIASFWVLLDLGAPHALTRARLFGDAVGTWTSQSWSVKTACAAEGPWTDAFSQEPSLGTQWFEELLSAKARYVWVEVFGNPAYRPGRTEARELEVYGRLSADCP
jgi:hypothetical protein